MDGGETKTVWKADRWMADETKTVWKAHTWMGVKLQLCRKLTSGWTLKLKGVEKRTRQQQARNNRKVNQ